MDRPAAGLEHDPCTDGDLLRRAYARVTPLCLDVKGQMNGFAALDIHPHRRYVVDIGGRRSCRCRLHINFALFLLSLDFTQNLGVTRMQCKVSRSTLRTVHFLCVEAFMLSLQKTKPPRHTPQGFCFERSRHLPIFTGRVQPTIFGTSELNFCVRNGEQVGPHRHRHRLPGIYDQLALLSFPDNSLYSLFRRTCLQN